MYLTQFCKAIIAPIVVSSFIIGCDSDKNIGNRSKNGSLKADNSQNNFIISHLEKSQNYEHGKNKLGFTFQPESENLVSKTEDAQGSVKSINFKIHENVDHNKDTTSSDSNNEEEESNSKKILCFLDKLQNQNNQKNLEKQQIYISILDKLPKLLEKVITYDAYLNQNIDYEEEIKIIMPKNIWKLCDILNGCFFKYELLKYVLGSELKDNIQITEEEDSLLKEIETKKSFDYNLINLFISELVEIYSNKGLEFSQDKFFKENFEKTFVDLLSSSFKIKNKELCDNIVELCKFLEANEGLYYRFYSFIYIKYEKVIENLESDLIEYNDLRSFAGLSFNYKKSSNIIKYGFGLLENETKENEPVLLKNVGNSCFMDSSLQCFLVTDLFHKNKRFPILKEKKAENLSFSQYISAILYHLQNNIKVNSEDLEMIKKHYARVNKRYNFGARGSDNEFIQIVLKFAHLKLDEPLESTNVFYLIQYYNEREKFNGMNQFRVCTSLGKYVLMSQLHICEGFLEYKDKYIYTQKHNEDIYEIDLVRHYLGAIDPNYGIIELTEKDLNRNFSDLFIQTIPERNSLAVNPEKTNTRHYNLIAFIPRCNIIESIGHVVAYVKRGIMWYLFNDFSPSPKKFQNLEEVLHDLESRKKNHSEPTMPFIAFYKKDTSGEFLV